MLQQVRRFHRRATAAAVIGGTLVVLGLALTSCEREQPEQRTSKPAVSVRAEASNTPPTPVLLYLPDGGDQAPPLPPFSTPGLGPGAPSPPLLQGPISGRCPAEMVDVGGRFCIDRYEAMLVETVSARPLSPYYPPTFSQTRDNYARWQQKRSQSATVLGRSMPVPAPPAFQLEHAFRARAVSRPGVVPSGYLSGDLAEEVCRNAGKRLCTSSEWVFACKGQAHRTFPYGETYADGQCNVFREAHPAQLLHGDASIHHLDPRLNQVQSDKGPLLRRTGATRTCASQWGGDAIYDMVGNLDEWVDDADGRFQGGFYARGTRAGCEAAITSHAREYLDYSLGVRCCL